MAKNFKEIGNDVRLEIGGTEFPITEVSYTEDADVSEQQFNTGLNPSLVVTGVSFSGSFAHAGANTELQDALYDAPITDGEAGDEVTSGAGRQNVSAPIQVAQLTIIDSQTEYQFENVIIDSRDKDFPADDRTEVSYDFMAERLTRSEASEPESLGLNRLETGTTPGFTETSGSDGSGG